MSTNEIKPLCVVRAPVATRSGYGDMSRDIIRHLIEYDKFDVKVHSVNWGDTPMNALDPNDPKDQMILDRILTQPLHKQPELFVSITVPNEFQALGKYNIGITAGIETTIASAQWVEGCNKMDAIFTISEHSKNVLLNSKYGIQTKEGQQQGVLEVLRPMEVLHNCIDTAIFGKNAPTDKDMIKKLDEIPEQFCYLFVGHWLRGDFGEDRKNVALLVKLFLETFKQVKDRPQPALILKTSSAGFSILDREDIIGKIEQIKQSVKLELGQTMPNIYVLHGELTEKEMNTIYNHPKVKAHVSFTKGEGFGRPLLEASVSGKPVIASGWSGHIDFLNKDEAVLIGGELKNVHPSAAWENVLMKEASWFAPNPQQAADAMAAVFLDYKTFKDRAYNLAVRNRKDFSYESIRLATFGLLNKYVPEFPKEVPITLPKLKKIELPKLNKVE
jgi:glycosyltransferase involved in cell wall biosynthesis